MGRDSGGIWFRSATPVVFQMQPVDMLEELKAIILRNIGVAGGTSLVRRVAYRLLNICPPNQFKFKIFWVDGDVHFRGMFDLHRRYGPREVMELLTKMQTVDADVGDEGSDEEFVGDTDDSTERSDGIEFVPESQCRRDFFAPTRYTCMI
ncbi:hypothetical protein PIB30_035681 [Stylosanthes scabra]|uniref:Uncharacterized protein n=1 Tax=Stylosanthes scabra TaxID=79078 RepID=A0ABU6UEI7_9FABA|nr:hypothetical protein [Stylosanthes scabra]